MKKIFILLFMLLALYAVTFAILDVLPSYWRYLVDDEIKDPPMKKILILFGLGLPAICYSAVQRSKNTL